MKILKKPSEMKVLSESFHKINKSVGFVPTMGSLHAGHLSLIKAARKKCDVVIVSIFVNPTQFGVGEDLDKYPRDIQADAKICEQARADYIFNPESKDIYSSGVDSLLITYPELSKKLCGKFRPGHFDGVTTVMPKLLYIVEPDYCFMGKKDGQQLIIIKKLVSDLFMDCEIIGCSTVRESSGLAMSSRNLYLAESEIVKANKIFVALASFIDSLQAAGDESQNIEEALNAGSNILRKVDGLDIQYFDFVDRETLNPVRKFKSGTYMICGAVVCSGTRLIDNFTVDIDSDGLIHVDMGVDESGLSFNIGNESRLQS